MSGMMCSWWPVLLRNKLLCSHWLNPLLSVFTTRYISMLYSDSDISNLLTMRSRYYLLLYFSLAPSNLKSLRHLSMNIKYKVQFNGTKQNPSFCCRLISSPVSCLDAGNVSVTCYWSLGATFSSFLSHSH